MNEVKQLKMELLEIKKIEKKEDLKSLAPRDVVNFGIYGPRVYIGVIDGSWTFLERGPNWHSTYFPELFPSIDVVTKSISIFRGKEDDLIVENGLLYIRGLSYEHLYCYDNENTERYKEFDNLLRNVGM